MKEKAFLLITALVIFVLPCAANAALTLNPGNEISTSYWACSNPGSLTDLSDSKAGMIWSSAENPGSVLTINTFCAYASSFSSLQQNFDPAGNSHSELGWITANHTAAAASSRYTDLIQGKDNPGQIPSSILLFAPGLAGILVRRNWPQKYSLWALKRHILKLIHHAPGFSIHGNLQTRILLTTGFAAYFQFVHFKLRTIQLNQ